MAVVAGPLSLEGFLRLPDEKPELEYFEGEVRQKVAPQGQHSVLTRTSLQRLSTAGEHAPRAEAFPELRATFAGASVVPDISVYLSERIPLDARGLIANEFLLPPDITIGFVSPQQSVNALFFRCLWYVHYGVQVAVLVDSCDTSVVSFRRGEMNYSRATTRINLSPVLPAFDLSVAELFASLQRGDGKSSNSTP